MNRFPFIVTVTCPEVGDVGVLLPRDLANAYVFEIEELEPWHLNSGTQPTNRQFLTITRDNADGLYRMDFVEAASEEEAQAVTIKARNIENGYGANDDGGFEPVLALDQDDLRYFLAEMQALRSQKDARTFNSGGHTQQRI